MAEDAKQFEVVSALEISNKIKKGEEINYDRVIIRGDLDIPKEIQSNEEQIIPSIKSIRIANSKIEGKFSIGGITIKGRANFQNTQFCKEVVFSKVEFNMYAQFRDSVFNGRAFFLDSHFHGTALFNYVIFKDIALFNRAKFIDKAMFLRAIFENDVAFNQAKFLESVNFHGAWFGKHLIKNQRFIEFPLREKSRNDIRKEGRTLFMGVFFKNNAFFDGAEFYSDAIFINSYFAGHAIFGNALFQKLCDFKQARFQRDANFEQVAFEKGARLDLRGSEFNIFIIEWSNIRDIIIKDTRSLISLVKSYDKLGMKNDANECYYAYRVFNRSSMHFGFSWLIDILEYLACGYGVRPINIIVISILIVGIFGAIYFSENGVCINKSCSYNCSPCSISINESLLFSIIVFAAKIPTDLRAVDGYNWLASLESVVGWFFLGIIMSAITKRIRM